MFKNSSSHYHLIGGWTTPLKNMLVKFGSFPQFSGWKFRNYLSCHHLVMTPSIQFLWPFRDSPTMSVFCGDPPPKISRRNQQWDPVSFQITRNGWNKLQVWIRGPAWNSATTTNESRLVGRMIPGWYQRYYKPLLLGWWPSPITRKNNGSLDKRHVSMDDSRMIPGLGPPRPALLKWDFLLPPPYCGLLATGESPPSPPPKISLRHVKQNSPKKRWSIYQNKQKAVLFASMDFS